MPADDAQRGSIAAEYYARNFLELSLRYEQTAFENIHADLLPLLKGTNGRALDIGAGSGRDAAWLAGRGWKVVAADPSEAMLSEARRLHPNVSVHWVRDKLPDLTMISAEPTAFDLILLSAVWMHVAPSDRAAAVATIRSLSAPGGLVSLSFKNGDLDESRGFFEVDETDLAERFAKAGFSLLGRTGVRSDDGIEWIRVILRNGSLPEGGT
jgi:SAM-dependent methyltransferase